MTASKALGNAFKLQHIANVKDPAYGAKGDGVTNDKAAVVAAFAASSHVFFPPGTYYLGNLVAGEVAVTINGAGGKVSILTDGQVKFLVNTTSTGNPSEVFRIQNAVGVRIGDLAFEDTGYDGTITFRGAFGLNLNASAQAVTDVRIKSLYAKNMVGPIMLTPYAATRVSGVHIGLIVTDTCTYGFNCQNNGDGVWIGLIYATNTKRSYFVYGCKQHDVSIYHVDGAAMASTTGNVMIARYVAGYDTEHLRIKFKGSNTNNNTGPIINFEHFGTLVGYIRNITLDLDIDSSTAIRVIEAYNYTDDTGGTENVGASARIIDRIFVKGRIDAPTAPDYFNIRYQPSTLGLLVVDPSIPQSKLASSVITYFTLNYIASPTWTPVLTFSVPGDVAVTYTRQLGTYTKNGRIITLSFAIVTSAFTWSTANGNCQITGLPFPALTLAGYTWEGTLAWSGITKAGYTNIVAQLASNASIITLSASGSGVASGNVQAADMPSAGAVVLRGTLTYEAAA